MTNPKRTLQRLQPLDRDQLLVLYNMASERKLTRFAETRTARRRTRLALEDRGLDFIHHYGQPVEFEVVPAEVADTVRRPVDARIITVLVRPNPKRPGTACHARYDLYRDGMSGGEYVRLAMATGVSRRKAMRDLDCDSTLGKIRWVHENISSD